MGAITVVEVICEIKPGIWIQDPVMPELLLELAVSSPEGVRERLPGRDPARTYKLCCLGANLRNAGKPGGFGDDIIHCALDKDWMDV